MSDRHFSHEAWLSKLRDHLTKERYAARTSRQCIAVARHFLRCLNKQKVDVSTAQPASVEEYLQQARRMIVAASLCWAGCSISMAFGFMDSRDGTPVEWKIALATIIGVIIFIGIGQGFSVRRFPWYVLLIIRLLIRAFMLRLSQLDLYGTGLLATRFRENSRECHFAA